ncbi:RhoGAP-domain-containing protein [Panus rudis PR-1116 ss-1]|nr:RhoGAP-domain-containing protein [Panus rudis PR-1116 ss-1]
MDSQIVLENKVCPGCGNTVVTEDGSVVVAFGQSLFHVDCFRCAKCHNQVTADTNLLLLSDGSPVCADCSYCCNVCGLPILDEAIMTSDDAYHAHCFNCKVCKQRIDELMFAKTSQGIYCMPCHNERVARSRRHQQRREKEKRERAAGDAESAKSKDDASRDVPRPANNVRGDSSLSSRSNSVRSKTRPSTGRSIEQSQSDSSKSSLRRDSTSSAAERTYHLPTAPKINHSVSSPATSSSAPPTASLNASSSSSKRYSTMGPTNPGLPSSADSMKQQGNSIDRSRSSTSPVSLNVPSDNQLQKRKSFNDKPLNVLLKETTSEPISNENGGLMAPNGNTSRRDKRRSINPAFALSVVESVHSPTAASFHTARSDTPPLRGTGPSPRSDSLVIPKTVSPPPYTDSPRHPHPQPLEDVNINGRSRSASSSQAPAGYTPVSTDIGRTLPDGRSSSPAPSLTVPNGSLRSQRSFDDRHRPVTAPLRTSASTLGLGQRSRSGSRPTSPAHKADVPHGVESGTDTEAEAEEAIFKPDPDEERPPIPPPKENAPEKPRLANRPPELKLTTSSIAPQLSEPLNIETADSSDDMSRESSPVEQTSHSTYIAPALPPIRFSLGAADFSELLKSVNTQTLKSLGEEDNETEKTHKKNGSASNVQASTPTSENTVVDSSEDATPMKRRDAPRSSSRERTPSPLSATSSQDHSSWLSHSTGESSRRNADGQTRGSLDVPPQPQRQRSSSLSKTDQQNGVKTHSREKTETLVPSHRITLTPPDQGSKVDASELVRRRLQEAVSDAASRGSEHVKLNMEFVTAILSLLDQRTEEINDMRRRLDGMKRTSQQYMNGLSVAQTEYDKELRARRDAEAEVTRLRVLLSGQAVKLTAISGEARRQEAQKALSRELSDNLSSLERDLSKLRTERDMTLAEIEELSATKDSASSIIDGGETDATAKLGRALSMRFDNIKNQYEHELLPLTQRRENLIREIEELKASRDAFLEETTMLNARNEELAQLNAQYLRRMDASGVDVPAHLVQQPTVSGRTSESNSSQGHEVVQNATLASSATSYTVAFSEESSNGDGAFAKISKPELVPQEAHTPMLKPRTLKWPGSKTSQKEQPVVLENAQNNQQRAKARVDHQFQNVAVFRVARCDHCGDKMWGSQLRCSSCNIAVHTRCMPHIHLSCSQHHSGPTREDTSTPPLANGQSMFGRDLIEQVHADAMKDDENRVIPVIVEKCIDAVDLLGMFLLGCMYDTHPHMRFVGLEYEGIYRKTGGSKLSKVITQLFERGDYASFDLRDTERFNDINSITSVLKTYFRALPDPLLTFALHDKFIAAANCKDPAMKNSMLSELINQLPREHYHTTKALMLHLHRVCQKSETNLMHARNLGVVFGRTCSETPFTVE